MNMNSFQINGIWYTYTNNKYYEDNGTIRCSITRKEYCNAYTDYLIS